MSGTATKEKDAMRTNDVAIYISIVVLFALTIWNGMSVLDFDYPFQLGAEQITLIIVIAVLLLFRYYSKIRILGLVEFENAQNAIEKSMKTVANSKEDLVRTISKIRFSLEVPSTTVAATDKAKQIITDAAILEFTKLENILQELNNAEQQLSLSKNEILRARKQLSRRIF